MKTLLRMIIFFTIVFSLSGCGKEQKKEDVLINFDYFYRGFMPVNRDMEEAIPFGTFLIRSSIGFHTYMDQYIPGIYYYEQEDFSKYDLVVDAILPKLPGCGEEADISKCYIRNHRIELEKKTPENPVFAFTENQKEQIYFVIIRVPKEEIPDGLTNIYEDQLGTVETSSKKMTAVPTSENTKLNISNSPFFRAFLLADVTTEEQYKKYNRTSTCLIETEQDWQEYISYYIPAIKDVCKPDFSKYDLAVIISGSAQWLHSEEVDIRDCYIKDNICDVDLDFPDKPIYAQNTGNDTLQMFFIMIKISKKDVPSNLKNIYRAGSIDM